MSGPRDRSADPHGRRHGLHYQADRGWRSPAASFFSLRDEVVIRFTYRTDMPAAMQRSSNAYLGASYMRLSVLRTFYRRKVGISSSSNDGRMSSMPWRRCILCSTRPETPRLVLQRPLLQVGRAGKALEWKPTQLTGVSPGMRSEAQMKSEGTRAETLSGVRRTLART